MRGAMVVGTDTAGICKLIADAAAKNPPENAQEIVAKFKTDVTRAAV